MKTYLVRHGDATAMAPRPLSERGVVQVEKVAAAMTGRFEVTRLLHSGKARALQTAEIIGARLAPGVDVEQVTGLAPEDDPVPWITRLAEIDAPVALVGHLPFMGRLAEGLLGGGHHVSFDTATVVCMERGDGGSWTMAWRVDAYALP